jgi:hypothetical protein
MSKSDIEVNELKDSYVLVEYFVYGQLSCLFCVRVMCSSIYWCDELIVQKECM